MPQRKQVEERGQQKRKRSDTQHTGRLCRFCKMELKQGPNSPHIHTGFPGVPGKYIYCPAKVFSISNCQGIVKEMTWKVFQDSAFYEAEKQRWVAEKGKLKDFFPLLVSVNICIYSVYILWISLDFFCGFSFYSFKVSSISSNSLHIAFDYQHDTKSPTLCTK